MIYSGLASAVYVLVFFDDIMVYISSWQSHVRNLHHVFQTLATHSLVINPMKCTLRASQVEYLGHVVSFNGVQMDPEK